jgi:beta-glucosidase
MLRALHHRQWRLPGSVPSNIEGTFDFIGVSYTGSETVRFTPWHPRRLFVQYTDSEGLEVSPESCEPHAEGLHSLLHEMSGYGVPLLVTGNGIATDDDAQRCAYLREHVQAVQRACEEGLDIRGFLYRSLLDGFEWTEGYLPRYGLVHVDRGTCARTPNPSAYFFKDICEAGELRDGAIKQFCAGDAAPRVAVAT